MKAIIRKTNYGYDITIFTGKDRKHYLRSTRKAAIKYLEALNCRYFFGPTLRTGLTIS